MTKDKFAAAGRTVFIIIMLVGLTLLIFFGGGEMSRGATYELNNSHVSALEYVEPVTDETQTLPQVAIPSDAYTHIKLTIGGLVTPASMLGSDTYGTFNSVMNDEGAEYFLSELSDIFKKDNFTVLGLAGVLSDAQSLTPKEKTDDLTWYLGSAKNVDVFSSSGVDSVMLSNRRTHDYGDDGYASTKSALSEKNIYWSDDSKAIYINKAGIKIGFYSIMASENSGEYSATNWLSGGGSDCNCSVVYVNLVKPESTGDESDNETYDSMSFASALGRRLVDAGASLVVFTGDITGENKLESYADGNIAYITGYLIDGGNRYQLDESALITLTFKVRMGNVDEKEIDIIHVEPRSDGDWKPKVK